MANSKFLGDKEMERLESFDMEILIIKQKKKDYLREIAKNKGLIAEKLEDLKSENGKPFEEIKKKDSSSRYNTTDYRKAVAFPLETAYLCHAMFIKDDPDSCGWVKGEPHAKEYNTLGPLSGSAGIRYYCRICGKQIAEYPTIFS